MSTTAPAIVDAGLLDRRISLQAVTWTSDEYGQPIETWTDLATVWAQVLPMGGLERVQASQMTAMMDTRFIIRWRGDLQAGAHRVVFDGRTYDVQWVRELGRREGLQLDALWIESPVIAAAASVRRGGG